MIRNTNENDPDISEREIKLFLSNVHIIQESLITEGDNKGRKKRKYIELMAFSKFLDVPK